MLEPSTFEAIGHFHFLRPWWLLGLLPLALLIYFGFAALGTNRVVNGHQPAIA